VEREVRLARIETLRAAVAAAGACLGAETAALVRHRYDLQLRRAEREAVGDGTALTTAPSGVPAAPSRSGGGIDVSAAGPAVVRAATEAQRRRLVALRADGTIGDTAFQRVEEELDWAELDWAQLLRAGQSADGEA